MLTSQRGAIQRPEDDVKHPATNMRGFGATALRVSALTLATQLIGFGSSIAVARVLGATSATDAYYLGLSVPMLVYGIFLTTSRQCAIPALTDEAGASRSSFVDASGQLISATLIVSTLISILAAAVAVVLMPLTGSSSVVPVARLKAIELAPLGVLGAMIGAMASVLAVRNRFAAAALVLGIDPLLRILLLLVAGDTLGTNALVIANLAGNALAVLVLWALIRREGIALRLRSPVRSAFVRGMLVVGAPLVLSTTILQLNPVIDRGMAGDLGSGTITALELGLRLFGVPMLLIGATLIGPVIATWSARKAAFGWPALRDSVNRATEVFTLIVPPVLVIGIALRHQIVEVMYHGGAYSAHATDETATVVAMLLIGLPAQLATIAFSTLFVIERRTKFCLKAGIANVILNVVLNFALRPVWGVGGIALSTSLTYSIVLAAYVIAARRRWEGLTIPFSGLLKARPAATAVLMVLVAYALLTSVPALTGRLGMTVEIFVVAAGVLLVYGVLILPAHDRNRALREFGFRGLAGVRENQAGR